jgi:hypothetical protein
MGAPPLRHVTGRFTTAWATTWSAPSSGYIGMIRDGALCMLDPELPTARSLPPCRQL